MLLSIVFFGLLASEAFAAEHLNIAIVTPTLPSHADGVNVTSLSQVLNLIGYTGLQRKEVVTTAIGAIVERFLQTFLGIPVYTTFVEISDMGNGMQNVTGSIYDGMDGDLEDQLNCTMDMYLAIAIAMDHANLNASTVMHPEMYPMLFPLENNTILNTFELFVTATLPGGNKTRMLTYISVCDGHVLAQYDLGKPYVTGPTLFPVDLWTATPPHFQPRDTTGTHFPKGPTSPPTPTTTSGHVYHDDSTAGGVHDTTTVFGDEGTTFKSDTGP